MILNNVVLAGRLTKNPELYKTKDNTSMCRFTLASDRMKTQKNPEPEADFVNCIAWRHNAEYLEQYGLKGDLVIITKGRIQTGKYDKNGTTVYTTDVIADDLSVIPCQRQEETPAYSSTPTAQRHRDMKVNGQPIDTDSAFDADLDDDNYPSIDIGTDDLPFY